MGFLSFLQPKFIFQVFLSFYTFQSLAQVTSAEKMAQLSFMVGDWEGISKSYQETGVREVKAHEVVSYKVDKHLITIDLESEALKLHTVIYFLFIKKERVNTKVPIAMDSF